RSSCRIRRQHRRRRRRIRGGQHNGKWTWFRRRIKILTLQWNRIIFQGYQASRDLVHSCFSSEFI
ncbi:MAG TPA: hypothetical protein VE378_02530, partial [Nitrososphaeraceae archaeon]|nr:hypothetical protein [Nitrososphaeraceae archaeon]